MTTATKELKVRITYDHDPMNPREDGTTTHLLFNLHRRYRADENPFKSLEDFCEAVNGETAIILPVYMYDHSGQTISTSPFSCQWDSGQVGYIYMLKSEIRKEYNWKVITKKRREQIIKRLQIDVEVYDTYMRGDVYTVETGTINEDGDFESDGESCSGFFGTNWEENGVKEWVDQFTEELGTNVDKSKWIMP
jgi:hypothetical protein